MSGIRKLTSTPLSTRPRPATPPIRSPNPAVSAPAPASPAAVSGPSLKRPIVDSFEPASSSTANPPAKRPKLETPRPGFTANAQQHARLNHNLNGAHGFEVNTKKPDLPAYNAAMPHRMSWKDIRVNTNKFVHGPESAADFKRWTDRFIAAGDERIRMLQGRIHESKSDAHLPDRQELLRRAEKSQREFTDARNALLDSRENSRRATFLNQANSFHANVPDLGPHQGVNNPVGERAHLNFLEESRGRSLTRGSGSARYPSPMSRGVLDMSPGRLSGIAVAHHGDVITVKGETVPLSHLSEADSERVKKHGTQVIPSFDPDAPFGPGAREALEARGGKKKR